jgi:hypothetical protein
MIAVKYWCYAGAGYVSLVLLTAYFNGQILAQQTKPAAKEPTWRKIDQSQYVGAKKCAECHAEYFDGWKKTLHAKMILPPIADGPDKTIVADFSQASEHRNFELKDVHWVIGSR